MAALRLVGERSVATPSRITAVAVTADGATVVTGHVDNAIRVWDGRTLAEIDVFAGLPGVPLGVAIGYAARSVALTTVADLRMGWPGRTLVIDLQERTVVELARDHQALAPVTMAQHAPILVVGNHPSHTLNVIDVRRLETIASRNVGYTPLAVAVDASGERILLNAGGASGGHVYLFSLSNGALTLDRSVGGALGDRSGVAFAAANDRIALGYSVRDNDLAPVMGRFDLADVPCSPAGLRYVQADAAAFSRDGRVIAHVISVGAMRSSNLLDIRDTATGRSLWCAWLPLPTDAPPPTYAVHLGGFAGAPSEHLFFAFEQELRRLTFEVE